MNRRCRRPGDLTEDECLGLKVVPGLDGDGPGQLCVLGMLSDYIVFFQVTVKLSPGARLEMGSTR